VPFAGTEADNFVQFHLLATMIGVGIAIACFVATTPALAGERGKTANVNRGSAPTTTRIDGRIVAPVGQPGNPIPRIEVPEWWQRRFEGMNARVKQGNVDLVFIGDSITQRWEQDGSEVWQKYYSRRNAVNLGIDGDRTQQVLWRLDHGNIDRISPNAAVVLIGTNNILGATVEEIADAIQTITEKLRAKLPKTKLLLLGILPRTATNGDREEDIDRVINEVNRKIAAIANNETVFFVDIGSRFRHEDGSLLREAFVSDAVHLSTKGYEIMAKAIEPLVARLMDEDGAGSK
jgi:beta-glucosidase